MIEFAGRGILLDIEGTTSSISYVHDVMFPFARERAEEFLSREWGSAELAEVLELLAKDAGEDTFNQWTAELSDQEARGVVLAFVYKQMDEDAKATGLKALQGLIWREGFASGKLTSHIYDDVPPALKQWRSANVDLRIYSSGSVEAQRQFFGHTTAGDLLHYFSGHYDTQVGSKKNAESYRNVVEHWSLPAGEILFLSDVPAELAAARTAGLQVGLCRRPGNPEPPADHGFAELTTFDEVQIAGR